MKPIGDIIAMVIDNGLFMELARCLGKTYKKVYYCCPGWVDGFPKLNMAIIGTGYPEIEVVDNVFGEHFDSVDLFIFPDVYFGELQVYLESQGKLVFGSRMGEELELDRAAAKESMKEHGLPVANYEVIKGTKALREYLKKHENVWVKVSKWRGHMETFQSQNYRLVEPRIDELDWQLGALKNVLEFVVEDDLPDCRETGIDGVCINGDFPKRVTCGVEVKDLGWVGRFSTFKDIPEPITRFEVKMKPVLKAYGYCGLYSSEVRIGKDKKPYWGDTTMRAGSPPNEIYQVGIKNLPEVVYEGAQGNIVEFEEIAPWLAEILVHCPWACKNWQPIDFDKKFEDNIKLRNGVKIDGRNYVVPQVGELPEIGAAVGWGKTMEAAIKMAKEAAESIEGYYIDIPVESTDKATEEIEALQEIFPDYLKD
jgi:predicted RNase H-like HicB family nuclease